MMPSPEIMLGLVSKSLLQHPLIKHVYVQDFPRGTQSQIVRWEQKNSPHLLPPDLKAFLLESDGAHLSWGTEIDGNTSTEIGCIHVNAFSGLVIVKDEDFFRSAGVPERIAFELDTCPQTHGRVVLYYPYGNHTVPQVMFISPDGRWHYIAATFGDYFRLAVLNHGIPGWCFAYTEIGLSTQALEWMAYLVPHRLRVTRQPSQEGTTREVDPAELDVEWLLDQSATLKVQQAAAIATENH